MSFGTVADWASVVVNGAVAMVAVVGLRHAREDARRAEERADAAERELIEDRTRRSRAAQARGDLANVSTVLNTHETLMPNVFLSPRDTGKLRAALAALPVDLVPQARLRYSEGSDLRPSREDVTQELHEAVLKLREISVTDA